MPPSAGGNHSPILLKCGIYTSPVANENAVHDLEHGAVWITYRTDLASADVKQLTAFARSKNRGESDPHLLLSPYPGLPAPVVASAWGKQLRLASVGDQRMQAFVNKYERGPQTPEPGATCAGGTGTPNG